jgi:hypothetical protein
MIGQRIVPVRTALFMLKKEPLPFDHRSSKRGIAASF